MDLFALLGDAARRHGNAPALFAGTEQVASFAGLREAALRLAGGLAQGARPGDCVLIAAKNRPEIAVLMFACWAAGLVVVPVNAKLHPRELADIARDCAARWAFVDIGFAPALAGMDIRVVGFSGEDWRALAAHEPIAPRANDPHDLAWLFYTSGTTGKSKGAMLTHGNLLAMAEAHWADIDDPAPGSCLIHAAPMSHGSGLYILPYLARGAAQVVPASGGFDPAEVLQLCAAHPGAAMFLAPTMVQRMCDHAEAIGADAAGLRLVIYGGGPMYVSDMRRALAIFGPKFAQIYGQGETPMTITGLAASDHAGADDNLLGSVGYPRSGVTVRVVDADGADMPVGAAGEIICRGPTVMAGYLNLPAASAAALRDGWLWTGDIGSLDARGLLTLHDRSKDLIISGGSNIYPREVEEALLAHPQVIEAAVVGEADAEWGEVVVAHVVTDGELPEAELDRHCLDRIARFKRPKRYHFHAQLPKNANGKIVKRALKGA